MKRFYRRTRNKVLAGVASGLADYFNVDPVWIRVVFVIGTLFGVGSFFLVYIILWIVLPKDFEVFNQEYTPYGSATNSATYGTNINDNVNNQAYSQQFYNNFTSGFNSGTMNNGIELENTKNNGSVIFGILLILVGLISFASMYIPFFTFEVIMPLILISIGTLIIFGNKIR